MKRISATIVLSFGLLFGALLGTAGLASAQSIHAASADCYPGCTGNGGGNSLTGTEPGTSASTGTTTTSSSSTLAFTGADVAGTVGAGVVLIAGGVVLVGVTRRRRQVA